MLSTKVLLKAAGIVCIVLEAWSVLKLNESPHPIALCTGLATLFGINSVHETTSTYFAKTKEEVTDQ